MNMNEWFKQLQTMTPKKAMPVLSFPATSLLGVTVKHLISDSSLQAEGMKRIAKRCDTLASVSLMDLSVEAEAFGSAIKLENHEVPTVVGRIVADEADVENLKVPQVGAGRTGLYIESIKKASSLITDRPIFAGIIGPFSLSGRLMDMTEIMINCYDDPDMVHKCLNKATEFLIQYSLAYKKAGANGILMANRRRGYFRPLW